MFTVLGIISFVMLINQATLGPGIFLLIVTIVGYITYMWRNM